MVNVALALLYFYIIGHIVHKLMGKDGNALHIIFVGGAGAGIGALLEWITDCYTQTFGAAIGLCLICAFAVEIVIRRIRHKLWVSDVHKRGWLTQDDIDGELHIVPDDTKDYENAKFNED